MREAGEAARCAGAQARDAWELEEVRIGNDNGLLFLGNERRIRKGIR